MPTLNLGDGKIVELTAELHIYFELDANNSNILLECIISKPIWDLPDDYVDSSGRTKDEILIANRQVFSHNIATLVKRRDANQAEANKYTNEVNRLQSYIDQHTTLVNAL